MEMVAKFLLALWLAGMPDPIAASATAPPVVDDTVHQTCEAFATRLASISLEECLRLELQDSGERSVEGVPILVRDYPPLPVREPRGRVLLFGGIHGDELTSVSIVFKWMGVLDRFHSGLFHWRIAPALNPDGVLQRPGSRVNANGVDLNRNFPCPDWNEATQDYWINSTGRSARRYPGPSALSEPESSWLAEQIETFDPDVIVSVHAPHSVVDFDGPPHAPRRLGSLELKLLGTYPGSLGRYAGVYREIPVVTIELPSALSMPPRSEQQRIWVDLIRWLKTRLPEPGEGSSQTLAAPGGP